MKKKKEFTTKLTWEEEQYGNYILDTKILNESNETKKKIESKIIEEMLKTRKILREVLNVREPFTYEELKDRIKKAGGIFRVAPNVPIKDFLKELEDKKIIYYNEKDNYYYFY